MIQVLARTLRTFRFSPPLSCATTAVDYMPPCSTAGPGAAAPATPGVKRIAFRRSVSGSTGQRARGFGVQIFRLLMFATVGVACSQAEMIYRIDFAGRVDSGTLKATPTTTLGTFEVAFQPGSEISGSLFAFLDRGPAPTIGSSGVIWHVPFAAQIHVGLPPLPPDTLLPIPDTFVIGEDFGAGLLQFASAQVVFPQFTFGEPSPDGRNFRNEGNFGAFLGPGSGVDLPPGALFPSFAATNLAGTGEFHILKVDQTINSVPPLFGLTEFYDISLNFTVTEASGSLVPEPGTASVVAGVFVLFWIRVRRNA